MNIIVAAIVALSGLSGAYYHWIQVRNRGESGYFVSYFFRDNTDGSKAAVVAWYAAMSTLYIAGAFDAVSIDAFVEAARNHVVYPPMLTAIVLSFTAGYAADSKLNSGIPPSAYLLAPTDKQVSPLPLSTDSPTTSGD